jgi:hypothetical protein
MLSDDILDLLTLVVSDRYLIRHDELLAIALAKALCQVFGDADYMFQLDSSVDESSRADWLETVSRRSFPLRISAPDADLDNLLKACKEQIRSVPVRGANAAVLSNYLDTEARALWAQLTTPYLCLRVDQDNETLSDDLPSPFLCVLEVRRAPHASGVSLRWRAADLSEAAAERLLDTFVAAVSELAMHVTSSGVSSLAPSDFPESDLDQQALDALIDNLE